MSAAGHHAAAPHRIVIVGGGATGVELASQLRQSSQQMVSFGLNRLDPVRDIGIHLVEAAPRVLAAMPERLSRSRACSRG